MELVTPLISESQSQFLLKIQLKSNNSNEQLHDFEAKIGKALLVV